MTTNATYVETLTTVVSTIQALGLTLNGQSVPVVLRKLPVRQDDIDPSTLIIVCPGNSPEKYEGISGPHFMFSPLVQIVIISPNNAEELSSLTTYLGWRESIVNVLNTLQIGLRRYIEYDVPIDREMMAKNYDYMSFGWRVTLWT